MLVKTHISPQKSIILAICDKELSGKIISQGKFQLDLSSNFYKGEKIKKEDVLKKIKSVNHINAVGKNIVNLLLKNNIISKEDVKYIGKTPYVICVLE